MGAPDSSPSIDNTTTTASHLCHGDQKAGSAWGRPEGHHLLCTQKGNKVTSGQAISVLASVGRMKKKGKGFKAL